VSTPRKPDLDQLINALTADGRPDELADRDAALASFRAARRGPAGGTAGRGRRAPFRLPLAALPARLAVAGTALVVAAAGVTVAAYAQALPGPVQQLAHTVLAPLGVPADQLPDQLSPGAVPSTASTAVTIAKPRGQSGKTPGAPSRTPSPRPEDQYLVTVAVARTRVAVNGAAVLAGRVTDHGRAAARARVRLYERLAGSTQWEVVATGVTGPHGEFKISSPPLAGTVVFRVLGPDNARSAAVRVTVAAPKITGRAAVAPGQAATE
jgi:hypothetical protein